MNQLNHKQRMLTMILLAFFVFFIFWYVNQSVQIRYDVNLRDYISLSRDYTAKEQVILDELTSLNYGGNMNEPPMGMYYAETGQYVGLVPDYFNALSNELSKTILTEPMVWSDALDALAQGQTHVIDMIPSAERTKQFAFSNPLYELQGVAIVPVGSQITQLSELNHKRVAAQKADVAIEELQAKNITPNFVYTDNLLTALSLMYEGQVEAVIGDEPVIWHFLNELRNRDDYKILDDIIYQKSAVVAVSKANESWLPIINKGILALRQKGILDQIEKNGSA